MSKTRVPALVKLVIFGAALLLPISGCGSADKAGSSSKKSEGSGSSAEKATPKTDAKTEAKTTETKHEGS